MTTWDREIARVADDLTALVAHSDHGVVDLDVALTARAAVLDGAVAVLGDLAPRTRHDSPTTRAKHVTVHQLERDPLGALGLVLRRRVRPELDRSPSELLDASRPCNAPTAAWASAGRHALLAARVWWSAPGCDLPGGQAWEVVGTVAALAEAIAVLDVDLGSRNVGARPDIDRVLASGAGLRIAAGETSSLARAAPTPGPNTVPEPSRVVTAPEGIRPAGRGQSSMSSGLGRLTAMLGDGDSLTPQHVRTCALLGRNLAVLAVRDGGPDTPRDALGDLARALHAVAHTDRGERAIRPSPLRALEVQLLDLHQAARAQLRHGAGTLNADEAERVQQRLPGLVAALTATTGAQVDDGRWAVPYRGEGGCLPFALATPTGVHEPAMLQPLREADAAAEALRDRLPGVANSRLGSSPAHASLDRQLRRWESAQRPVHPARPVASGSAPAARRGPAV